MGALRVPAGALVAPQVAVSARLAANELIVTLLVRPRGLCSPIISAPQGVETTEETTGSHPGDDLSLGCELES